jgi:hypothetical protein
MTDKAKILFDLRAWLYMGIATGSAFLVQTEALSNWNDWTSLEWFRTGIGALIGGATALRAYVDQSISKRENDNEANINKP